MFYKRMSRTMFNISDDLDKCNENPIWQVSIPQPHAETCPICGGSGKKKTKDYPCKDTEDTCHGCGGLGWITVR